MLRPDPSYFFLINSGTQVRIAATCSQVLGNIVLPYTNPADTQKFAAIHSDPPGIKTAYPAVVLNKFKNGRTCYIAGDLESIDYEPHRQTFLNLIKWLAKEPFCWEAQAPRPVEITVLHQPERRQYIINLINFQSDLPNIPVEDIKVRLQIPEATKSIDIFKLPEKNSVRFKVTRKYVDIYPPKLQTFMMLCIEYS